MTKKWFGFLVILFLLALTFMAFGAANTSPLMFYVGAVLLGVAVLVSVYFSGKSNGREAAELASEEQISNLRIEYGKKLSDQRLSLIDTKKIELNSLRDEKDKAISLLKTSKDKKIKELEDSIIEKDKAIEQSSGFLKMQDEQITNQLCIINELRDLFSSPAIKFLADNICLKPGKQICTFDIIQRLRQQNCSISAPELGILIQHLFKKPQKREIKKKTYYLGLYWKET